MLFGIEILLLGRRPISWQRLFQKANFMEEKLWYPMAKSDKLMLIPCRRMQQPSS